MGSKEPEILLVHRPRYDDWSFPKGKLDRGESTYVAAVREVEEETGLRVRLGPRLPDTRYSVGNGQPKIVDYWAAKAPKHADITGYRPNNEIDDLRWVPLARAYKRLSYGYDVELLEAFASSEYDTSPLIVIRHAQARSRRTWHDEDSERPLSARGTQQAHRLVPLLRAYGIKRVISSDAVRCVDTVLPYVNSTSAKLKLDPNIAEDAFDPDAMLQRLRSELDSEKRVAICSHRPVLPDLFRGVDVEPVALEPGALLILHRRDGKVVAVEEIDRP